MRAVLLATSLFLATSPAFAGRRDQRTEPPPAQTVTLPCDYAPGAVHRYRVERRSERRGLGLAPRAQGDAAVVALTVVSHDDARTVLDAVWSERTMTTPPTTPPGDLAALLDRTVAASSGVPVRVEVDHATSAVRVVDSAALLAAYGVIAEDLKAAMRDRGLDAPVVGIDAALTPDKGRAEASLLEDLNPLFGFTCGAVPVGEETYATSLPNPFGGEPLPATATLGGVVGPEVVTFAVHERLDPVRVMDQLGPLLEQTGAQLPKDAGLQDLRVDLRTDLEVVVDRETGWVRSWSSARVGSALGGERTDTVTGTRLP